MTKMAVNVSVQRGVQFLFLSSSCVVPVHFSPNASTCFAFWVNSATFSIVCAAILVATMMGIRFAFSTKLFLFSLTHFCFEACSTFREKRASQRSLLCSDSFPSLCQ